MPAATSKLVSVNFHLIKACDSRCRFCFAEFRDVHGRLCEADAKKVIAALRAAGAEKLTFAGGEPTLHPNLCALLRFAKGLGLVTSLVTNGSRLDRVLDACGDAIDWVALSVDSPDELTQQLLGRGHGDHVARAIQLAKRCHALGVRVKLNTVVTALNCGDDLSDLVRQIAPVRWKVFQVLRVEGQNDGNVEALLIEDADFDAFLRRHQHLADEGYPATAEANDAMMDSYVMVDPLGRFFGNSGGVYSTSPPLLSVGVERAFAAMRFDADKFEARGGRYVWGDGAAA